MGIFFTVPLYLQMVLGLTPSRRDQDAPVSVMMFLAAAAVAPVGPVPRALDRQGGLWITGPPHHPAGDVDPELKQASPSPWPAGPRMGLLASQLGNGPVVGGRVGRGEPAACSSPGSSSARPSGRPHRGGRPDRVDDTFVSTSSRTPRSTTSSAQVSVAADRIDFVSTDDVEAATQEAGLDETTSQALVDDYQDAQLTSLKTGLLAAALLAFASLAFTRDLPRTVPSSEPASCTMCSSSTP
jgi:hypothetical protein